jgi:hypothetical protein
MGTIGVRKSRWRDECAAIAVELGACVCRVRHGVSFIFMEFSNPCDVVWHGKPCCCRPVARSGSCRCAIYVGPGVLGLRGTRALLESGLGELAFLASSPCVGAGERNDNNG